MNLNKNFLTEVIKYLINRGVTLTDVLDTFNEHFNTLDAFNDSLKNMPTEIKRGTINNVIEEPVLPKYTMTESDKVKLESVSPSPETLNKVFDFSKEKKQNEVRKPITDIDLLLCGRSVEESSTPEPKTKMMLVNGRMTEMKVSDTDLVQSSIEKPAETLETETETLETQSNTEKHTETVTNESELKGNNVTAVILDTPNHDVIHGDKNHCIEKALKKFITSTTGIKYEESKKDKKTKEVKADLTVLEICQKMNVTTHELREMINTGDFPQPDCDKKWSVKLLKDKGII